MDCPVGELSRAGAIGAAFWIDLTEKLTISLFTQLMPHTLPLRPEPRRLVRRAIVR
jgi:hypothetical protein